MLTSSSRRLPRCWGVSEATAAAASCVGGTSRAWGAAGRAKLGEWPAVGKEEHPHQPAASQFEPANTASPNAGLWLLVAG